MGGVKLGLFSTTFYIIRSCVCVCFLSEEGGSGDDKFFG